MNERIRELHNQARDFYLQDEYVNLSMKDLHRLVEEKFAELIVRECVAICQDVDGEDSIEAKSGRQDCAVEIREHFGVKE
jgi:hypothetical protein